MKSMRYAIGFRIGKVEFFVLATKQRGCAETYAMYVAQISLHVDTVRLEKGPFRTKTN